MKALTGKPHGVPRVGAHLGPVDKKGIKWVGIYKTYLHPKTTRKPLKRSNRLGFTSWTKMEVCALQTKFGTTLEIIDSQYQRESGWI